MQSRGLLLTKKVVKTVTVTQSTHNLTKNTISIQVIVVGENFKLLLMHHLSSSMMEEIDWVCFSEIDFDCCMVGR